MNHRKFSTNVIRVSLLLRMINYILLYNVSLRFVSLQGEKERAGGGGGERKRRKQNGVKDYSALSISNILLNLDFILSLIYFSF